MRSAPRIMKRKCLGTGIVSCNDISMAADQATWAGRGSERYRSIVAQLRDQRIFRGCGKRIVVRIVAQDMRINVVHPAAFDACVSIRIIAAGVGGLIPLRVRFFSQRDPQRCAGTGCI